VVPSSTAVFVQRFGGFELDARTGELRRDGTVVKLQPQPFRVLELLAGHAGELVTREELKKALWGEETYVDFERGLNFCINQVRAALGDSAESPQFIQTLPRRGYRFIAEVTHSESPQSPLRAGSESTLSGSTARLKDLGRTAPTWQLLLLGVALLTLIVAGATFLARTARTPTPPQTPRTMIAVLPLEDLTGDPPPSWFADGLTDELIAQIGRVSPQRLGIIARTSAMTYRGSSKTVGDIGRELGVSHVVEGSLRREGNRLRVTVQLVGVADQTPIWSETYDRSVHGALTIQSEIAAQVARALALELLAVPWTAATWTGTRNPAARDALLRGRYFLNRGTPGDFRTALTHVEEAARQDPSFAAAHAARAEVHHLLAMFGVMPPVEAYTQARGAASEAVRLDANLGEAHAAMGLVHLWANWNPGAASVSFARAIALNPSDAAAHHDYAWALVALERFDEAAAHVIRARELDPVSPRASNDIGWLFLQIRQPSEAMRACRQTLALDPESIEAQQCLERAHMQRGEVTEALAAARTAALRRQSPMVAVLDEAGTPEERLLRLWRWRLERLQSVAGERYVSPYTIAMHYAVLGDEDAALAQLERAYESRAAAMVLVRTDPIFERLHEHPRFIKLVEMIHP
jgi:TolB-like protein/DNA-binding winged helix-turn-helix (wHTH) protein/Tfp pilus assembly protein PilF